MALRQDGTRFRMDRFTWLNTIAMLLVCASTLYPIWYILVNSITGTEESIRSSINFWPQTISLDSYKVVFRNSGLIDAFGISVARTVLATALHVFFTAMVAYGLSKRHLLGRKTYMTIGIITMLFNGGLIPTFLLFKNLQLYDQFLVYILPTMFSFYNLIIFVSFFKSIPEGLEESAKVDGANEFTVFVRIVIPCSKAVFATLALFVGVYNWNDYFFGVIYIDNESLRPIQTLLYKIVSENSVGLLQQQAMNSMGKRISPDSIKFATMVVATIPIVLVYPFLQRYFVKGLMIGSIKG